MFPCFSQNRRDANSTATVKPGPAGGGRVENNTPPVPPIWIELPSSQSRLSRLAKPR
jgi:hypothetical protein